MLKYINELKDLNIDKKEYVIFGSGPLAIRNLITNSDIDLLVSQNLWNKLSKKHKIEKNANGFEKIEIKHIEIYKDWTNTNYSEDKIIKDSEIINNLPFAKLKYVIKWKQNRNKEKDKKHLKLIKEYLIF